MIHDPNGPSQLEKREGCPGSGRMEEAVRVEESGTFLGELNARAIAAAAGSKLHEIMADCVRCGRRPEVADLPAFEMEDIDALQCAYDYAAPIIEAAGEDALPLVEVRLDLASLGIEHGGTIDLAVVHPGRSFFLIDWKFGGLPVRSPRYNRQMQAYAYGLIEQYGCVNGGSLAVVQPRASVPVKADSMTADEVMDAGAAIRGIVARAKDPQAPLIPGDHCTFCRAKEKCPARKALAEATIANKSVSTLGMMKGLEPTKRIDAYERLKLAKAWVESALGEIDAAVLDGKLDVPGLGIGEGRKNRAWVSEHLAQPVLEELLGAEAWDRSLISPAQAEKKLGKNRAVTAKLKPITATIPGKPRVVRVGTTGALGEDD